jgi:hypothetical protein
VTGKVEVWYNQKKDIIGEKVIMNWIGVLTIFAMGLICLLSGIFNWNWFFNSRKVRNFVNIFGRTGSRVFYMVFGAIMIIAAICFGINQQ